MMSPAMRHKLRATGAQRGEQPAIRADATLYEQMLVKLAADRRRLHDVQSIERRAEVKREILPDYVPWIDGVLAGNQGVQDDVLMTVMVWRIDSGDLSGAMQIGRYAIAHNLAMPDQYKRTTACLLAEEAAEVALRGGTDQPGDANQLLAVGDLVDDQDMPDEVRAKLLKAIGYALAPDSKNAAVAILKRALELHAKVGVKKDIERLEREIKNATGDGTGESQTGPG